MSKNIQALSVDELKQIVSEADTPHELQDTEYKLRQALDTDTGQAFENNLEGLSLDDICNKQKLDVYANLTQLLPEGELNDTLKERLKSYIQQFLRDSIAQIFPENRRAYVLRTLLDTPLDTPSQQESASLSKEDIDQLLGTVADQSSPLQPLSPLGGGWGSLTA